MAMTISERGIDRKNSILCVGRRAGGMHTSALSCPAYKVSSYLYKRQVHNHMNEEKGGEKEKGSGLV